MIDVYTKPKPEQPQMANLRLATGAVRDETSDFNRLDKSNLVDVESHQDAPRYPQCGQVMLLFKNAGMWICKDSHPCPGTLPLSAATSESQSTDSQRN